jgi:DNA-binding transcriptional MerR regulator
VRTYTIGEVADRSGFSASALRYYDGIGLVPPSSRTDAGYRQYDDHTLARLAFIARARQLGCSLDEITDLVALWDGDRCGPAQRRFHDLVTGKIAETQTQIVELTALADELRGVAGQLAAPAVDGPCGDDCACIAAVEVDDRPIACTLGSDEMPQRLDDWQALLGHARARSQAADGSLRVEFDDDVDAGTLARAVAAEQACCAFFSFVITVDDRGVGLEVHAPADAADIVASLFGSPA